MTLEYLFRSKGSGKFIMNPIFFEQFEDEYRRLWLLQNRPGGLEESLDWQFCR